MARRSSDNTGLLLEHGIDIPARTIYLTSCSGDEERGVDWQMADRVLKGLALMSSGDLPIKLVINNFGGEDDHARAIIGAIRDSLVPVHGIIYGRAQSAAAWIFQACDHRTMCSRSNLMLHMGSGDKTNHSEWIDKMFINDVLRRMQERDPTYSKQKLANKLREDWFVYPSQALALGLADEIQG